MAQNNLRIIYNNVIDTAILSTSSAVSGLPVANLQNEAKGLVWRSFGTSATLTATWAFPQTLRGVVFPFCNLSPTATIRVKLYTNIADSITVSDTGEVSAGAYTPENIWGDIPSTGVNSYSFGGGSYARVWFNTAVARKIEIIISDPANPSGYLEAARLVCGDYWSPTYNTNFGLSIGYEDSSTQTRTESGNLLTTAGTIHRTLNFELQWLTPEDKTQMLSILRGNGLRKPLFVSIFPQDTDKTKEQQYQIYGKLTNLAKLNHPIYSIYTSSVSIEEI